ncbi:MAG: hypothetical protein CMQ75_01650 [Gammaproteobacteria bacterium]|nr:hypothetical protein [Gammaproteobacteria bacterium]RPG99498.1 MAG: hypothetical protein CBC78_001850 [Candidatus Pelagibacter sp. TMED118]|tara:strand:+ start:1686 stop:2666 length:981 start_codon:yes stop_codon:yes gene_type:complete
MTDNTKQEQELDISLDKTKAMIEEHKHAKNFYWLNGIEEYLQHRNHPQLDVFQDIKKVILYANPWALKNCVMREIERGETELTQEWVNIIMAKFIDYKHVNHRKLLRYMCHCIDDEYLRTASIWSIKWQEKANVNDHFSRGQVLSKLWMIDQFNELFGKELGTVVHYGGWYATIAQLLFEHFEIEKYWNLEIDADCIGISEHFNRVQHQNEWQFKASMQDCDSLEYKNGGFDTWVQNRHDETISINVKPNLIINTSCEHMTDSWFHNLPDGMLVCLQTNDYFDNPQHSNCVHGVDEAKQKYPMSTLYYEGEIDTELYNRFMLIGKK